MTAKKDSKLMDVSMKNAAFANEYHEIDPNANANTASAAIV